jgi:polyhydroxyalkanoic acid synthase PhaR subunit
LKGAASMSMNSNDKEKIHMPDFAELWKEMYFKTETAWADAFKELISTQTFVGIINKALEQNLSNENVTRQMVDKYMEISPVPSKKDIARVAELVISLEEKIDQLEYQFSQTMGKMADSLIKMADHQASLKEELHSLQQSLTKASKTSLSNPLKTSNCNSTLMRTANIMIYRIFLFIDTASHFYTNILK